MSVTLYLCGKMRGLPRFGFDNFDAARDYLTKMGIDVISPADLDRDHGFDPAGELGAFDVHAAMRRDIAAVLDWRTDGVVLIKGWRTSEGSAVERAVNHAIGGQEYEMVYDGDRIVGIEAR